MKPHISLVALVLLIVGCQSTDTTGLSKDIPKEPIDIHQGMTTAELKNKIGEPDSIRSDIQIGKRVMDRWHYEIVVSRTQEYGEIDTDIDPRGPIIDPIRPQKMANEEAAMTVLYEQIRIQMLDILIYEDKVFAVKSEFRTESDMEDRRGTEH